jgi:Helix-turn-helix domain
VTTRKMRIASDIAHGWARNFRLGDSLTKFVLMAVTLYVNDEGSCFVGMATLADDTELSENTIRRRLVWLEEIGAIKRIPQWLDPRGRRTSDPLRGGKRTSDEIKLCLDADPTDIEACARGTVALAATVSPASVGGLDDDPSPACVGGLNAVSPSSALHQPSHVGEGLNPLNGELEVRERERDTRASELSTQALNVADQCYRAIGHQSGDLVNLCGLHYEIQRWISAGHAAEALVAAFKHVIANRGENKPLSYVIKAMNSFLERPAPARPSTGTPRTQGQNGTYRNAGFIDYAIEVATEHPADG